MVLVVLGADGGDGWLRGVGDGDGDEVGGRQPRRPGRGGGRRWRSRVREIEMPDLRGSKKMAGDFTPVDQICILLV